MIPAAFDYVRASSLTQAIGLLRDDPDGAKVLAGGHTLLPSLKLRLASPALLIDIAGLAELKGIDISDGGVRIGALTTHAELLASEPLNEELPVFRQAAGLIADPQVRNRGTIGGSLANADPAADWPAVMLALRAEFEIAGSKGFRRVPARDFFIDIFSTVLEADEILTGIHIPRPNSGTRFIYRKIRHPASGFAVVGIAVAVHLTRERVTEAAIGVTGAANHAFEGEGAADFLIGKALSGENIEYAAKLLRRGTACLSDRYAAADYRANLLEVETRRALLALSR